MSRRSEAEGLFAAATQISHERSFNTLRGKRDTNFRFHPISAVTGAKMLACYLPLVPVPRFDHVINKGSDNDY